MNRKAVVLFIALAVFSAQFITAIPEIEMNSYSLGETVSKESLRLAYEQEAQLAALESAHYSLQFVGDVLLARNVEVLMQRSGSQYPFEGMSITSLSDRPATFANFEASMAQPHTMTPAYQVNFSVDEKHLSALSQAGYTHVSLANNHSNDYGEAGFKHTSEQLGLYNVKTFGQGETITENSVVYVPSVIGSVAVVGINASVKLPDQDTIKSVLSEASQDSEMQIIYVHWGTEYDVHHNASQRRLAELFIKNGADLIIGHHPHVVQDIELIHGVPVFYSLGNFIFDQYFSVDVQQGLVLTLEFTDAQPYVSLYPISSIGKLSQPRLMEGKERDEFVKKLADRSDRILKEAIESRKIQLLWTVATSTKTAIMMQ